MCTVGAHKAAQKDATTPYKTPKRAQRDTEGDKASEEEDEVRACAVCAQLVLTHS